MKYLIKPIFQVLLMGLFTQPDLLAQNLDKYIVKGEDKYQDGDYKKAAKQFSKLKSKSISKLGSPNKYLAIAFMKEAKINYALGQLFTFQNFIDNSLVTSKKVNQEASGDHALLLLEATDLMIAYGNFRKAEDYLNQAREVLEKSNNLNDDFKADIDLKQATVLSGKGYYTQAVNLIDKQNEYFSGRAVSKETSVDKTTGKIKTVKLDEQERLRRYRDYAYLMTLKAQSLDKQGDFVSSDSAFLFADNWINKNLGKNDIAYLKHTYLWGKMLEDNGVEKIPIKKYEKASSKLKSKYKPTHILNLEVQQDLIKAYFREGEKAKMNREKSAYDKVTKNYFGKNSFHNLMSNALELDLRLSADKTKNVKKNALNIINNTRTFPPDHPDRIDFLEFTYLVSKVEKNYNEGEKYLNDILKIKAQLYGEETPEYALSEVKLANHYLDFGDNIKEAEDIYQRSFFDNLDKEITSGHSDYVDIINHLAELYVSTDRYQKASETLDLGLDATRAKYDNQDPDYAIVLDKIANLQIKIGKYEKATENNKIALDILDDQKGKKEDINYSKALETQAKIYTINGEFDKAEDALNKSRKIASKTSLTERAGATSPVEDMAKLYIAIGEYSKTEKLLNKAVSVYEIDYGVNSRKLINPLIEMSRVTLITGDYTDAEKFARRSFNIANERFGDQSSKTADAMIQLASIYSTIGDYEKAEDNITKAMAIEEKTFGADHVNVAKSKAQLALIKYHKGDDVKEIETLFTDARNIIGARLGATNPLYAEILKNLSLAYSRDGRTKEAFLLLNQSEKIWEKRLGRRNNVNLASIYVLEGDIYYHQHDYKNADKKYNQAKKLYEKVFNKRHPNYVKVVSRLARVEFMEGDIKKSRKLIEEAIDNYNYFIKVYFPALSEREKAKFWNTIKHDFEFYNTIAVKLMRSDDKVVRNMYNNALLTKSLLLSSSIKMRERILNSGDTVLISRYQEWIEKKELMTNVLSMSLEQLIENEIDPGQLEQELELLEKELSEKSELFSHSFEDKKITWIDVKESLKPNEAAIEMVRFRYFDHILSDSVIYAALWIKQDLEERPEIVLLNNGKDLEDKYYKFHRNSIKFKLKDRVSYGQFWQPIESKVGAYSTIYLSADGIYNQINLEAIAIDDTKYVLDNSNIILISNTKDIYIKRHQKVKPRELGQNRAILFGNPTFYVDASNTTSSENLVVQLPGTQKEIEELSKLLTNHGWEASDYLNLAASEDQIKQSNNPKVFHIATHGFFTSNEDIEEAQKNLELSEAKAVQNPLLRTGLMLAGAGDLLNKTSFNYNIESGILTAYEAMNLNFDYTDLVVLSACETGLGDVQIGEGVYGLQRAFLVAGAKVLIMSLFKVSDEATQKLMVKFYQRWLETGEMRNSFLEAKKEVRNEYKYPIFWASFIMIGMEE